MEIKVSAILFHEPTKIEEFIVTANEKNYKLIIKKLEAERQKIINHLKDLKNQEQIKSVFRPKNKQIQVHLDKICKLKKQSKQNINKLKIIYN